tara:strand:- start:803 stop:1273 length:471 start_codon:yes stop_codon:yes gene_type:complete
MSKLQIKDYAALNSLANKSESMTARLEEASKKTDFTLLLITVAGVSSAATMFGIGMKFVDENNIELLNQFHSELYFGSVTDYIKSAVTLAHERLDDNIIGSGFAATISSGLALSVIALNDAVKSLHRSITKPNSSKTTGVGLYPELSKQIDYAPKL